MASAQDIIDTADKNISKKKTFLDIFKKRAKKFESYGGETLSQEQIDRLEQAKQREQQIAYQKRMEAAKLLDVEQKYRAQKEAYANSRTGRFNKSVGKVFGSIQRFGTPAQAKMYYQQTGQLPPPGVSIGKSKVNRQTIPGMSTGKKGRPKGTLNPLYAKYGGVYGYRKAMAHERMMARLQAQQQTNVSPEQRQYLQLLAQRKQQSQQDVERQTFPDTYGQVNMKGIFSDIDDATNLVP
jgi:hypothetical protein